MTEVATPGPLAVPVGKPLQISPDALIAVVGQCRTARSETGGEACGFVAAAAGSDVATIVVPMTNIDPDPAIGYAMADDEVREVYARFDAEGVEPLAVYHSHTLSSPLMSEWDLAAAHDVSLAYLIVGLAGSQPKARAYRVDRTFIGAPLCHEVMIDARIARQAVEVPDAPWALQEGNRVTVGYLRHGKSEWGEVTGTVLGCNADVLRLRPVARSGVKGPASLSVERLRKVTLLEEGPAAIRLRRQMTLHARHLGSVLDAGDDLGIVHELTAALSAAFPAHIRTVMGER